MTFPLDFAHFTGQPGVVLLRAGFVLTIVALAFIIRQPVRAGRKKEHK